MSGRQIGARRPADGHLDDEPQSTRARRCATGAVLDLKKLREARDFYKMSEVISQISKLNGNLDNFGTSLQPLRVAGDIIKIGKRLCALENILQLTCDEVTVAEKKSEELSLTFVALESGTSRQTFTESRRSAESLLTKSKEVLNSFWDKLESSGKEGSYVDGITTRFSKCSGELNNTMESIRCRPWSYSNSFTESSNICRRVKGELDIHLHNCQNLVLEVENVTDNLDKTRLLALGEKIVNTITEQKTKMEGIETSFTNSIPSEERIKDKCAEITVTYETFCGHETICYRNTVLQRIAPTTLPQMRASWAQISAMFIELDRLADATLKVNYRNVAVAITQYEDALRKFTESESRLPNTAIKEVEQYEQKATEYATRIEVLSGSANQLIVACSVDAQNNIPEMLQRLKHLRNDCTKSFDLLFRHAFSAVQSTVPNQESRNAIVTAIEKSWCSAKILTECILVMDLEDRLELVYPMMAQQLQSIRMQSIELSLDTGYLSETDAITIFKDHELNRPLSNKDDLPIMKQWIFHPREMVVVDEERRLPASTPLQYFDKKRQFISQSTIVAHLSTMGFADVPSITKEMVLEKCGENQELAGMLIGSLEKEGTTTFDKFVGNIVAVKNYPSFARVL